MNKPTWRSPNEIVEAGIEIMLDGKSPINRDEQVLLMNFIIFNVDFDAKTMVSACGVMKALYPQHLGKVSESDIKAIVAFQALEKMNASNKK